MATWFSPPQRVVTSNTSWGAATPRAETRQLAAGEGWDGSEVDKSPRIFFWDRKDAEK